MIGVLGGTFNPIHFGHLRPALEITEALHLREMRLIPCALPPHRAMPEVEAGLRLQMVQAAAASEPRFVVDERELHRDGPSFSVDTLLSLREELANEAIGLLIGMDAFVEIHTWHRWEQLIELAHLVVMQRPGYGADSEYRQKMHKDVRSLFDARLTHDSKQLHQLPSGNIWLEPVSQLDISASKIRMLIQNGNSPRYLLPDEVLAIIEKYHLYR